MRTRTVLTVAAATLALSLGPLAGLALAHVEVSSPDAAQGAAAALSFEVPSEKDLAFTQVEIALPLDTPLLGVTVPPMEGWSSSTVTAAPTAPTTDAAGQPVAEVVSRVVFTATAGGVQPEGSAEFVVDAGTMPAVDSVVFKVLQTYSDGSVASWIQESVEGAPEPDFPAPVLSLVPGVPAPAAAPTAAASVATTSSAATTPASPSPAPTAPESSSAASSESSATPPSSTAPAASASAATPPSTPAQEQAAGATGPSTSTVVVIAVVVVAALAAVGWIVARRRRAAH